MFVFPYIIENQYFNDLLFTYRSVFIRCNFMSIVNYFLSQIMLLKRNQVEGCGGKGGCGLLWFMIK